MSEGKKKKTTRKIGYADDAGSTENPLGRGVDSVQESEDDSDSWTDAEVSDYVEDEDSSDTCNSV